MPNTISKSCHSEGVEYISLVSKGSRDKFASRYLLRLSIALPKASILGVRNLPFTILITLITALALVILYLQTPFFSLFMLLFFEKEEEE
jgi:hypothetical protein